jgi:hypothetical protein
MPSHCANTTGLKAVALEPDCFVYKRDLFVSTLCVLVAAYNKNPYIFLRGYPDDCYIISRNIDL